MAASARRTRSCAGSITVCRSSPSCEHELNEYPTPKNLNYWWNFGSLAGIMLVIMIVTGIFLAMNYTPHVDSPSTRVERIMRDVNYGWLMRYIHMNGASFFFIVTYIHIFRGLYYGSYKAPRELLWMLGVVILLLMMATAFMGYVLPWGQMSFWGATVITNLFSAIPGRRQRHRHLAVGRLRGRQPDAEPLLRAALPAAVRASSAWWSCTSWRCTSTARTTRWASTSRGRRTRIPFHPYYTIKDIFGLGVFLIDLRRCSCSSARTCWAIRTTTSRPTRCRRRRRSCRNGTSCRSTPSCARSRTSSLRRLPDVRLDPGAVRAALARHLAGAQRALPPDLQMGLLAAGDRLRRAGRRSARTGRKALVVVIGRVATLYYFVHFLVLLPLLGKFERPLPLPESISAAGARRRRQRRPAGAAAPMEKA